MSNRKAFTVALSAAFVGCVFAANWTLERYGLIELPALGWMAPAGVLWAGLTFGIRDAIHELGGRRWVVASILIGAGVSYWLSDAVTIPGGKTSIAVASGVAFLLSESVDFAVYSPLRERHWIAGVVASNLVGSLVDSLLFLWMAFGAVDAVGGQMVGKAAMTVPALFVVKAVRTRAVPRHRIGATGA